MRSARNRIVLWIKELRVPFLSLSVVLVSLGLVVAWSKGFFDPFYALLTYLGVVVCLHGAVDVLNDYFDLGIDLITTPTPFSGGSRMIPEGLMSRREVLAEGLLLLIGGCIIGAYITLTIGGWFIPVLLVVAAISLVIYSPVFSKLGLGELVAGLNFGPLIVLGTYYVQTSEVSLDPILTGTVVGIMTAGILYINEFPDYDADKAKGRYHLPIRLGKARAARLFKVIPASAYTLLICGVILRLMPLWSLLALLAVPSAVKAVRFCERYYDKPMELIPGMASMIKATLSTGALLAVAYIIYYFFPL